MMSPVYIALIHSQVYNKNRQVVRTCLTPMDIHDISRVSQTYGVKAFFFINPMRTQRELAQMIFDHWITGWGAQYNPNRKEAISLTRIISDFSEALDSIEQECGQTPKTLATSAQTENPDLDFPTLRKWVSQKTDPLLLLFGTGWGLTEEIVQGADFRLQPIKGTGAYNHLSVRSAVSIILDRILGDYQPLQA